MASSDDERIANGKLYKPNAWQGAMVNCNFSEVNVTNQKHVSYHCCALAQL
jgi:hypothetical protein